jgi:hypothetical protein
MWSVEKPEVKRSYGRMAAAEKARIQKKPIQKTKADSAYRSSGFTDSNVIIRPIDADHAQGLPSLGTIDSTNITAGPEPYWTQNQTEFVYGC